MTNKSENKGIFATLGKKQISIFALAIVIAIIVGVTIASTISANDTSLPERRNIFTLYDSYNMTVVVVFDNEPPPEQNCLKARKLCETHTLLSKLRKFIS